MKDKINPIQRAVDNLGKVAKRFEKRAGETNRTPMQVMRDAALYERVGEGFSTERYRFSDSQYKFLGRLAV